MRALSVAASLAWLLLSASGILSAHAVRRRRLLWTRSLEPMTSTVALGGTNTRAFIDTTIADVRNPESVHTQPHIHNKQPPTQSFALGIGTNFPVASTCVMQRALYDPSSISRQSAVPATAVISLVGSNPSLPSLPVHTGADSIALDSKTLTVPLGFTSANTSLPNFWQCVRADAVLGLAYPPLASLPPTSGGGSCLVDALNKSSTSAAEKSFGLTATTVASSSRGVTVILGAWKGQAGGGSGSPTMYWWSPVARTAQGKPAYRGVSVPGAVSTQHILHLRAAYIGRYSTAGASIAEQSLFKYNTSDPDVPHAVVDASITWIAVPPAVYEAFDAVKDSLSGQGNGACITEASQGQQWTLSTIVCPLKMISQWPGLTLTLPASKSFFMGSPAGMAAAQFYEFRLSNRQLFCCGSGCNVQSQECVLLVQPLPTALAAQLPQRYVLGTAFLNAFDGAFDIGREGVGFAASGAGATAEPSLDPRIPGQEPSPAPTPAATPEPAVVPSARDEEDGGQSLLVAAIAIPVGALVLGGVLYFVLRDRCRNEGSRKNRMEQAAIAAGSARVAAQGTALGNAQSLRRALDDDAKSVDSDDGAKEVGGAVEMTRVQHAPESARDRPPRQQPQQPQEPQRAGTRNPLHAAHV